MSEAKEPAARAPAPPPAPTAPPRPAAPPRPPAPPAKPPGPSPKEIRRRNFLKAAATVGGVLAATPYIPFGAFLRPAVLLNIPERQEIKFVDGSRANIKTLPLNQANIFVWPRFDNPKLDSEPFRRWQLIRLPAEMGGEQEDVSALRAYSMICVHLWCLWNYSTERSRVECPCHGSIYAVQNGKAIEGPASLQAPPNNALAQLKLEIADNGAIAVTGVDGVVGYGRRVT